VPLVFRINIHDQIKARANLEGPAPSGPESHFCEGGWLA
jgi:hypothetical protein